MHQLPFLVNAERIIDSEPFTLRITTATVFSNPNNGGLACKCYGRWCRSDEAVKEQLRMLRASSVATPEQRNRRDVRVREQVLLQTRRPGVGWLGGAGWGDIVCSSQEKPVPGQQIAEGF